MSRICPELMATMGTSLIRNCPPPWDCHRILLTVLLEGPGRALFLMSEVPLYLNQAGMSRVCPKLIAMMGPVAGAGRPSYAHEPLAFVPEFRKVPSDHNWISDHY